MRLANAATRHWHDLAGEHAGAVALRHAVLVVDLHPEQPRRRRILLIRLDKNDKNPSC